MRRSLVETRLQRLTSGFCERAGVRFPCATHLVILCLLAAGGCRIVSISRADIYAGGLGVSAVAMLGRAVDRRAQMVVTAGWPDVGRA